MSYSGGREYWGQSSERDGNRWGEMGGEGDGEKGMERRGGGKWEGEEKRGREKTLQERFQKYSLFMYLSWLWIHARDHLLS